MNTPPTTRNNNSIPPIPRLRRNYRNAETIMTNDQLGNVEGSSFSSSSSSSSSLPEYVPFSRQELTTPSFVTPSVTPSFDEDAMDVATPLLEDEVVNIVTPDENEMEFVGGKKTRKSRKTRRSRNKLRKSKRKRRSKRRKGR